MHREIVLGNVAFFLLFDQEYSQSSVTRANAYLLEPNCYSSPPCNRPGQMPMPIRTGPYSAFSLDFAC
jgi:hypothetical protein